MKSDRFQYKPENAETYHELGIKDTTYEMAFNEAGRMLDDVRGKKLLDFGCGAGRSTKFLKEQGAQEIIGVDHNENMVERAQKTTELGVKFHLIKDKIPLPDNDTDGALSTFVFPEMKSMDEMKQSLMEINRVLKPGSIFVLAVPNPEAFGHNFKNWRRDGDPNKLKSGDVTRCIIKGKKPFIIEDVYWTEEDYRRVLELTGFKIDEVSFPKAKTGGNWMDETKVAPEMVIKARKKIQS